MNAFKLALTVSVAANVVLAFVVMSGSRLMTTPPVTRASVQEVKSGSPTIAGSVSANTLNGAPTTKGSGGLWTQLERGSYQEIARQLEAAGFPRSLVVQIVMSISNARFRAQFSELAGGESENQPYWKATQSPYDDPTKRAALAKLQAEQREQLTQALGDEYWLSDESYVEFKQRRYGNLPLEKLRALSAIEKDYDELRMKVYREGEKNPTAGADADMTKLRLLEAEKRADIARLLTPEQLFEFDLRSSGSAWLLRNDTGFLNVSEEEFRALYPAYQTVIDRLAEMDAGKPADQAAARLTLETEINEKVKALLGAERFADYLQAKDPASKKLNLIVQRLELPLSAARAVVAVQDDVTRRADAIRTDKALTAGQRDAQFTALAEEAKSKITGSIGERGYAAYLESSGKWLRGLQSSSNPGRPVSAGK